MQTSRKGISRSFTLGIVIVVIAVAGMGAIFAAGSSVSSNIVSSITTAITGTSTGQTTSVSTSSEFVANGPAPAGFSQSVLQNHITNVNARNVNQAVSDYTSGATMVWEGNTQGLGGTYTGSSNIRFTYQTAIGGASSLSYTLSNFTAAGNTGNPNVAIATATEDFTGSSHVLGSFNGVIQASYDYVLQNGQWLIQQETSNYQSFTTQYSLGSTTFPQWQATGPSLPSRYSESPFKNFVYYDGGAIAAIAIAGYLASLPLVVYVRKKRGSNRSNETPAQ